MQVLKVKNQFRSDLILQGDKVHFRLKSLYEYKYEHLCACPFACDVEKDMLLCPIIFLCFCVPQLLYDYFEVDGTMSFLTSL